MIIMNHPRSVKQLVDEQIDKLQMQDSRLIGILAKKRKKNKKKIDREREQRLIEKSSKTRCECNHPTFSNGRCSYHTCRHTKGDHK